MLRLITGRSGFGKTEWIYREIERYIKETDGQVMLLVPEQFSFETERALLDRLGPRQGMRVDAYSFTRLAENVFRRVGGLSGERLTDGSKAVLMRLALSGLKDKLTVFARAARDTAFLTMMLSAVTEWKQACITPDTLWETAGRLSHPTLKAKATESAMIYGAYDALVGGTYLDPLDELTRLRDALRTHKLLENETIFIDAFRSFTGQELAVIEELLIQCREVNVSLCLDKMDNRGQSGLFFPVEETARQLKTMAKRNGIPIAPFVKLTTSQRFQNTDLSTLEACVYRHYSGTDLKKPSHIEIYSAADPYEEADIVAESIHRQARTKGMQYGDFAVIARNTEAYRGIIDAALEKYGIAYYMSKPESIDAKPLFTLLFSVLAILADGFRSDEVFRYLKTGLAGLSVEEISDLENYTLLWRKDGAAWQGEWSDHPGGFRAEWRDWDRKKLADINRVRARAIDPILRLKTHMPGGTALSISKALYAFLLETGVDRALMAYEQRLADAGEHTAAGEQSRLWDILMELLDQMARTAGEMTLSVREYQALFRLVVAATDISFIPQTQDSVIVGNADTIRAVGCQCVYLLGANEGLFPLSEMPAGLFSDYERRLLMDAGLPILNARERAAVEERLYAYAAMTAPSQRLIVTFARTSATGGVLKPSSIVAEICRIFTGLTIMDREQRRQTEEGVFGVEALHPAFEWTARHWHEKREPFPALRAYFRSHPDFRDKTAAIERAVNQTVPSLDAPETAKRLFGDHLTLSATQIDTYHACRYRYFLRYGLRARPRGSTAVDPMTFGSVVHFVLEHAVRDGRDDPAAYAARAEEHARTLVAHYVSHAMGGPEGKPARFAYLVEKMVRTVRDLIEHIMRELLQSEFVPVDFELSIGADGEIPFPAVALPSGGTVAIRGDVDRVDVMEREGKHYLRVVDYKTGGKDFSLAEVMDGLQVQMFLYLMCLVQNGGERYGTTVPAGVLYMPAKREPASLPRNYSPEDVEEKQSKSFQMKGMLLHDPAVLRGMDEQLSGRYIPVKVKKDGTISAPNHLAELSDFGRLFGRVEKIVLDMAEAIHEGALHAVPMQGACEWCDYRRVCRRESGATERKPLEKTTPEILDELRKEGEHGEEGMDTGTAECH